MTKHSKKKKKEEENALFWGPFGKNIRKSDGSTKLRLSVISVKVNFDFKVNFSRHGICDEKSGITKFLGKILNRPIDAVRDGQTKVILERNLDHNLSFEYVTNV